MFIIVKNIHAGITLDDLEDFIKPVLGGGLFRKTAFLKAIKIVAMRDKKGTVRQRHGLFRTSPDSEKKRLVKALNKRRIVLERFEVAEYIIRHWNNDMQDRRRSVRLSADGSPDERRKTGLQMITIDERLFY